MPHWAALRDSDEHLPFVGYCSPTDPQSMDYPNGLPKWTTPKNNIQNEYCLMFLAANILKLHIHNFRLCSSCTYMCWKINTVRMLTPGKY